MGDWRLHGIAKRRLLHAGRHYVLAGVPGGTVLGIIGWHKFGTDRCRSRRVPQEDEEARERKDARLAPVNKAR